MKQFISNKVYYEVWKVLEIKKETKEKIPEEILTHICKKANKSENKIEFNKSETILKDISQEAFCLYLSLYLQYVAAETEKEKIKKILIENEIKYKNS